MPPARNYLFTLCQLVYFVMDIELDMDTNMDADMSIAKANSDTGTRHKKRLLMNFMSSFLAVLEVFKLNINDINWRAARVLKRLICKVARNF